MEFATIPFAYLLLLAVTGAWALAPWRRLRNGFLLLVSYYFAWKWQPLFLAALIASSLGTWAIGEAIWSARTSRARLAWSLVGVGTNLGFLGFFKYWNFFIESVGELGAWLGLEVHGPLLTVLAPLGLSFYTFQNVAYLLDVRRGIAVRPGGPLDYALFVAYFPRFAAGPILRSHELLPQVMAPAPRRIRDGSRAIMLIAAGLAKKMVLGTYLATHMTEDLFQAPTNGTALELWTVVFAYSAQLYLDFSGYTDIARGCSLLLGFELPENFHYPYAARDLGDYWRRWHATFSRWLRDYIYFPLGGSRGPRWYTARNLVLTFLVCGLWHGPTWGFVVWGGLHGLALAIHKLHLDRRRALCLPAERGPVAVTVSWALTLLFCALARVFFKSSALDHAGQFLRGLVGYGPEVAGIGLELGVVVITALTIALNLAGSRLFEAAVRWHDRVPVALRPLAWTAMTVVLLTARPHDIALTIYIQF